MSHDWEAADGVSKAPSRALVTGAGGMLASDLLPALAGAGYRVFPRSRADLDVTDAAAVTRAFRETRPGVVVNCAAYTKVDDCEANPLARASRRPQPVGISSVPALAPFN